MKTIAVIPARYASTRMPGKPLADVLGKPMIWWVYQAAKACPKLDDVLIATDDERIADACKTFDPQQDCKFACCFCRLQLLHIMNQNKFLCFSHFSLDALNDSFHFILRCVTIVGICPDNEACTADAALTQSVQMMILQYLCFACFSFISYIAENVTMSIKNHTVSLFSEDFSPRGALWDAGTRGFFCPTVYTISPGL